MPTLSKPPAGVHGHPLWDSWHELKSFGYRQREYLVSGTARALDGSTAPYTTRIIVSRPRKASRSNGTVMLDWVNVTAQFENAVDTLEAREMLLREGWTYVHVSAQKAGLCCSPLTPQVYDPVRYAAINHPGDQFSADIFSQIAQAMRSHQGLDPMRGLKVKRVIAAGQSQSADKLYGYVNQWQTQAQVIDGFLIHGNGTVKKTFQGPLDVPVLNLLADREAEPEKPTKDRNYRLWEVAGTGHSGYFIGVQSVDGNGQRVADQPAADRAAYERLIDDAGNYGQIPDPRLAACTVYRRGHADALRGRHRAAPAQPLGAHRASVPSGRRATPSTRRVRSPRTSTATPSAASGCPPPRSRWHATRARSATSAGSPSRSATRRSRALYPTFDRYQRLMKRATNTAVRRGWLLPIDARDMMRRVCTVQARYPAGLAGTCRSASYQPPKFATRR